MKTSNRAVALIVIALIGLLVQLAATGARAQTQSLDDLFAALKIAGPEDWEPIEKNIWLEWSKSGSKAMDLLLERGKAEMTRGNFPDAIGHFSALIDHAPEFSEGWNARATAFFLADEYGLSMADIRQTLLLEPRHFGAMAGLGMILERLERPKNAMKIYLEAQKVHPNRPDVLQAIERLKEKIEGATL
jgi:tetratricopeptide (TPR) repeat protein